MKISEENRRKEKRVDEMRKLKRLIESRRDDMRTDEIRWNHNSQEQIR